MALLNNINFSPIAMLAAWIEVNIQPPDHLATSATFLEISFGVNVAFAAFKEFRDFVRKGMRNQIKLMEAECVTLEFNEQPGNEVRIQKLKQGITNVSNLHTNWQYSLCNIARTIALLLCIEILIILYFDLLTFFGAYIFVFILPFPLYVAVSYGGLKKYVSNARKIIKEYEKFVNTYETSDSEKEIKAGIASLGSDDDDSKGKNED